MHHSNQSVCPQATKGPWEVGECDDAPGKIVIFPQENDSPIAEIIVRNGNIEEAQANAQLFAGSRELKDAAESVLAVLKALAVTVNDFTAMEKLETALSKMENLCPKS